MTPEEQWLRQRETTLGWLRLGFSLTAILLVQLNPRWTGIFPILSHLFLYSFFLYSLLVLYIVRSAERPNSRKIGFVTTCVDLLWISLILSTHVVSPIPSFTFFLFLFPIIISGFRYGIKGSLSVALIGTTIYGFIAFAPFWWRPMGSEAFVTFSIPLLVVSYILGCLFDLEMKQIQKLLSFCKSAGQAGIQEERRRIARELHDRVLQVLGSVTYKLEACRKSLVGPPEGLEEELALSEEATRSSMTEIRSVLSGKVMDQFTPGTLLERLEEEIKSLHDSLGLKVVLEATPEHFELAQEVEQEIYYAAREGLTNIARHSHASEASLSLKQTNGELTVCLQDNGMGFEPTAKGDGSSYGLQSMRERVSKIGGDLSIKTAPGKGTHVSFTVPLSPTPARPGLNERLLDLWEETRREGTLGWSYMTQGVVTVIALLVIVIVPYYYFYWPGTAPGDLFTDAIIRYQKVTQGTASTTRPDLLLTHPPPMLDMRPWGYRIVATQNLKFDGQRGRVFVYQGQDKKYMLAHGFTGVELSPPPGGRIIRASNREFVSYSRQGVNVIAWKDKDLICVLTSTLPQESLLGLAQQVALGR
jgi:signal transduction histidine kinase